MKSIRAYLLSRVLGGSAIILTAAGISVYLVATDSLENQFDHNLQDRINGFASILFQKSGHVEFEFSDELMPEYSIADKPAYFQLWYSNGHCLERSESLGPEQIVLPQEAGDSITFWNATLSNGRPCRFAAQWVEVHHVYPEEGPDRPEAANILVAVARGRDSLTSASRKLLLQCLCTAGALLGLLSLLVRRSVSRGLEPANRLAATLDGIHVEQLPDHLEFGELPAELLPVGEKSDALIRRVSLTLERERRTTADIAHELRTPIAEILTAADVTLRKSHDNGQTTDSLREVRNMAWRMGRSVNTLLKMARLDMGAEAITGEPIDLCQLVSETLVPLRTLCRERELQFDNSIKSKESVIANADILGIIISNLIGNSLQYAPHAGRVACSVHRSEDRWTFAIENAAGDLTKADLPALSDPFWRKDPARSDRNRSGLGLALSKSLAEAGGLQLDFELENGQFRALLSGPHENPATALN